MTQDPVCGMDVDTQKPPRHDGQTLLTDFLFLCGPATVSLTFSSH